MACHHFHPVQAGLAQAAGGGAVTCDYLVDHPLVERTGHDAETLVRGDGRGIGHRQQAARGLHDLAPRVEQLRQHEGAVGMAGFGQFAIARDAGVLGGHQHVRGVARAVMNARHLQHDQAHATFGAGALVGDQGIVDPVVGGQAGVVPAGHDAVLQALATELQGLEQVGKACMAILAGLLGFL